MDTETYDIAIIGGGPAGLMAAATAAENGSSVILLDEADSFGNKLHLSDTERCTITNTITDTRKFIDYFDKKGRFLYPALNHFGSQETVEYFNSKGHNTLVEDEFIVSSASTDTNDLINVLLKQIERSGGILAPNSHVTNVLISDNRIEKIILEDKEICATSYIFATGGCSAPQTKPVNDVYAFAIKAGHTIIDPLPILSPVMVTEPWVAELQGISLTDMSFSIYTKKQLLAEERGDAVFTANGLNGSAILNLSRALKQSAGNIRLKIDLFPDQDNNQLTALVQKEISANNRKRMKFIAAEIIPESLLSIIFTLSNIDPELPAGNLAKEDRKRLVKLLKSLPLTIHQFYGFEKAMTTSGGIDLKEIDGKTMQSKRVENLYFAGEIIDLDGPAEGFNLQVAWTTGYTAGISAACSF